MIKIRRRRMNESRWRDVRAAAYRHTMTEYEGVRAAAGLMTLSTEKPLWVGPPDERRKVVDEGFLWLQLAPENGAWWLTAMYDEKAQLVEFYFDVTAGNHLRADGDSWFDDLFVDVVLTPGKPPRIVDADELAEAVSCGLLSEQTARNALSQAQRICVEYADTAALESFCEALLTALLS